MAIVLDNKTNDDDFDSTADYLFATQVEGTESVDQLITAAATNDHLYGFGGNDAIAGGSGNDVIWGGAGNDVIWGGAGNDSLTGGTGNDTFIFDSLDGVDLIADFSHTDDSLAFDLSVFSAAGSSLTADEFLSMENFAGGSGLGQFFIYDIVDGDLFYDADGAGANAAVQIATLTGSPDDLAVDDFSFVA